MSNSRLLSSIGGDHTTTADWETFITTASNYNGTDWDDTVDGNGGDQTLRFADELISEANPIGNLTLATATYYKVTWRPDTENSVTSVGEKASADGKLDLATLRTIATFKTPGKFTNLNHNYAVDLSEEDSCEWHFEGLTFGSKGSSAPVRSHCFYGPGGTKDVYIDRCVLTDSGDANRHAIVAQISTAIFVRSCVLHFNNHRIGYATGDIAYLGCVIAGDGGSRTLIDAVTGATVDVYGCALYEDDQDGATDTPAWNNVGTLNTDMNVTNRTGANWTVDFVGAADVDNSTRAAMFTATDNQEPKVSGPLDGLVTWADLPAGIQSVWPDTDFYGNTITKSGAFAAGAVFLASAGGGSIIITPATGSISVSGLSLTASAIQEALIATGNAAVWGLSVTAASSVVITPAIGSTSLSGHPVTASAVDIAAIVTGVASVSGLPVLAVSNTILSVLTGSVSVSGGTLTAVSKSLQLIVTGQISVRGLNVTLAGELLRIISGARSVIRPGILRPILGRFKAL